MMELQAFMDRFRGLLRNRAWRLLWGAQAVSSFGDAFFDLAMSWLVFVQSGSALQAAGVYAATGIANLVLGPIGGTLADRWDRRRTMATADVLRAGIVGAVAVLAARGPLSPWLVYAAVFALNGLARLFAPARFSVIPDLVGRGDLAASGGLFSAASNAAHLVGSAAAGVLIAAAGAVWAVVVDAASFVVSTLVVTVAPIPPRRVPAAPRSSPFLHEVRAGWRVIMDLPALRAVLWLALLANAGSFVGGLMPALVRLRLHGGADAFGAIESVSVAGAVAGGTLVGWAERRLGVRGLFLVAMACNAAAFALFAASTSVALTAGAAAFDAVVAPLTSVPMTAVMQAETPPHLLGRVGGTFSPVVGALAPLAALVGGALADRIGPAPVCLISAGWALAVAGAAWRSRALRAVRLSAG